MEPSVANVRYLLSEYSRVLDELRKTDVIRSKNNPLADYAEWLVSKSMGLELCPKSTKGHDATLGKKRYEIKARRITVDNGSRQLSAIRDLEGRHFDYLIGVLFTKDFQLLRAAEVPWKVVQKYSKHNVHTNSAKFILSESIWDIKGVRDITGIVQKFESQL